MTLTEVKNLLGITSTDKDVFYGNLIPELESFAREFCNNEDLIFTTGVKFFVAKACQYAERQSGIASEQLGDYSVTYAVSPGAFPPELLAYLYPYRRPFWA